MELLSGEWYEENWNLGDSISTGNDIKFKMWHGVELETKNLRFNSKTEVFETGLLRFIVMKDKVIINYHEKAKGASSFKANKIYKEKNLVRLVGNASFSTTNTIIKANEIIVDQTR